MKKTTNNGNEFPSERLAREHNAINTVKAMLEKSGVVYQFCERDVAQLIVSKRSALIKMLRAIDGE